MKPTDEQIKEVWGWCGAPYRTEMDSWDRFGYPKLDLNSLFKYAVPKLEDPDISFFQFNDKTWEASIEWKSINLSGRDLDPALALFWAIWELIKK